MTVAIAVAIAACAAIAIAVGVRWSRPKKTLWDVLELLIVPLSLALLAVAFNSAQGKQQRDAAVESDRDSALRTYLDEMSDLMLRPGLTALDGDSNASIVARTLTLTTLRRMDGSRRGLVVRFLAEAKLIRRERNVSGKGPLRAANLTQADLRGADLRRIDLTGAHLEGADFSGANLGYAIIDGAHLDGARLTDHVLAGHLSAIGTGFANADLTSADFQNATLIETCFVNARLRGVRLDDARLFGARLYGAEMDEGALRVAVVRQRDLVSRNCERSE